MINVLPLCRQDAQSSPQFSKLPADGHCRVRRLLQAKADDVITIGFPSQSHLQSIVVKRCLVCPVFLTSVCIVDCHAIRIFYESEYSVLSMRPIGIARYKQEKQV